MPGADLAPQMHSATLLLFLLQITLLLTLAVCLGRLAIRLGTAAVVGELLAGVIVGPSVLGYLGPALEHWLVPPGGTELNLVDGVGQIGVLLLVGITGAQVDLGALCRYRGAALRVGLAGFIVPLAMGVAVGFAVSGTLVPATSPRPLFAVLLGVAMAASAIPVMAKTLADLGLLHRNVGQIMLAAGVLDGVAAWFLLSLVSSAVAKGLQASKIMLSVAAMAAFLLAARFVIRPAVRMVLSRAARASEPGPTVCASAIVILACAVITQALGMEAIFGAFVGGLLVGLPGAAPAAKLAPLRTVVVSVLAPVFFATAGLRIDLAVLARGDVALWALALLGLAIFSKFSAVYVGARVSRFSRWESAALGAGMNARGAVEVVIAAAGLRLGLFSVTTYTVIVLIAIVTSVIAPPLLRLTMSRVETDAAEMLRLTAAEAWADTPRNGPAITAAAEAAARGEASDPV